MSSDIGDTIIHAVTGKRGIVKSIGVERVPRLEIEWEDGATQWLPRDMVKADARQQAGTATVIPRKKKPVKPLDKLKAGTIYRALYPKKRKKPTENVELDDPSKRTPEQWTEILPQLGKWAFKRKQCVNERMGI